MGKLVSKSARWDVECSYQVILAVHRALAGQLCVLLRDGPGRMPRFLWQLPQTFGRSLSNVLREKTISRCGVRSLSGASFRGEAVIFS